MRRNDLVLRQHTVDRRAQACRYDLLRRVYEDVVDSEVRRDALANFTAFDLFTNGDDLARAVDALAVSTEQKEGTVSPQLPSPASGTSSGHGRNPGDHNPPVRRLLRFVAMDST